MDIKQCMLVNFVNSEVEMVEVVYFDWLVPEGEGTKFEDLQQMLNKKILIGWPTYRNQETEFDVTSDVARMKVKLKEEDVYLKRYLVILLAYGGEYFKIV